jgi:hypothetical protein
MKLPTHNLSESHLLTHSLAADALECDVKHH